ncbi:hypothetical protein [Chitinophaga sp. Cy-1792]|uniref:hypothetical protein n=1 Tax=Chitinophaga sp. Cy-1792 TaxID=2608339 RepID=UPI00141DFB71|nr:hypothetical protein [Chitinophaga sp. Cy-1792]NIG57121.1 hypothetical protein [Chitinophaga sp. Cy-1792]
MHPLLKRFHRISGIVIATFLVLHLSNHLFALGGPDLHIRVMKLLRPVYRFPPVEILLMLCVLMQVLSGLSLVITNKFYRKPYYVFIQVATGLYLSFFMIYHVRAVLMGRYLWHTDTNFFFAAGVANRYPEKLFFIPYYTLSLVCAFAHIACIHYIKRKEQLTGGSIIKRELLFISIGGSIITLLIMLSLTGVFYPIR